MDASVIQSERIEVADDLWAANAFFEEKGWTDGLPIIPPTEERVGQMLAAVKRNPQDVIGVVPPRWAPATVEKIAINAVMAGCLPQYMPVLIAAADALTDPKLNLYALQATTGGPAIMLIVNGPIRKQLDINGGSNVLGEGWRANASGYDMQSDPGLAGQIQSLHRGKRRSEPVGSVSCGARLRRRHEYGNGYQRG